MQNYSNTCFQPKIVSPSLREWVHPQCKVWQEGLCFRNERAMDGNYISSQSRLVVRATVQCWYLLSSYNFGSTKNFKTDNLYFTTRQFDVLTYDITRKYLFGMICGTIRKKIKGSNLQGIKTSERMLSQTKSWVVKTEEQIASVHDHNDRLKRPHLYSEKSIAKTLNEVLSLLYGQIKEFLRIKPTNLASTGFTTKREDTTKHKCK